MIPRIIHQCWIGPKPMPARETQWCARMALINPTWQHRLHGNELFDRYRDDPYVKTMMERQMALAFVADRLRVLLLRDEGGIYLDADCQPIRPLDSLGIWDRPDLDFVAGLRSPHRNEVALHRGVALVDNHFMASTKGGRMVGKLAALWSPAHVLINGHACGCCMMENADPTTLLLGQKYFCAMEQFPETVVLHDCHNLSSWTVPKTPSILKTHATV